MTNGIHDYMQTVHIMKITAINDPATNAMRHKRKHMHNTEEAFCQGATAMIDSSSGASTTLTDLISAWALNAIAEYRSK